MKAAKIYAREFGWSVVPLHDVKSGRCSCGKTACLTPKCKDKLHCHSAGKHPRIVDWVNNASKESAVIDQWIQKYPDANVGIATGDASGFFCLDIDPEHGGQETLDALIAEHGELPHTVRAITGSGGQHFLFKMIPGLNNSASKIGEGIDTRGNGGQIVVAPSVSVKGPYKWAVGSAPWECPILEAPAWLVTALTTRAMIPEHVAELKTFPPATPEVLQAVRTALDSHGPAIDGQGGGLHTVQAAAIATHDFALTDEEAWPLLVEWNETCEPPWDLEGRDSLREKLTNGRKYGKAEYGCKRKPDPLSSTTQLIEEWRTAGSDANRIPSLIERVRDVVAAGALPSERALIEIRLKEATGLGPKAQALPSAQKRAIVLPGSSDTRGFDCSLNGTPIMNINNVMIVLEQERAQLAFDTFLQTVIHEDGREWTDDDTRALTFRIQREVGLSRMPSATVMEAVLIYAQRNKRNSVTEYLEALEWDGEHRIAGFLTHALGAPDSEYIRSASQNFWRSLVARPMRPGCKVDNMIVLEGEQGILKSSALKAIGGEWFAEAAESPNKKDFFQGLNGKLLIEIAELDSFNRADVTAVKRVLSCQVDRYRVPYGKLTQDFPRQGIFAGTTNRTDWSRDETGARRFWPIPCAGVDLPYIRENRDQLFAEAVADLKNGEPWWVMPKDATLAEQEARLQLDPWEDLIALHVAQSERKSFAVIDLLTDPLGVENSRMGKGEQMRVASILRRIGLLRYQVWRDGRPHKLWKKR